MKYRELGKTGLRVSEVGFGPEWMKGTPGETRTVAETCREGGMNLLDCWMADPLIRDNLGYAMKGHTDEWIVQGHFGACVLRPVHVLRTLPAGAQHEPEEAREGAWRDPVSQGQGRT